MGAVLLMLAGAIIGGVVSWFLQRWWTPDRSAEEVAALREQISKFQIRLEELEKERSEMEYLPLGMRLQQTVQSNYICLLNNDSDVDVKIESIKIVRNEVLLSETKRREADDWTIPARSGKELRWAPMPDPAQRLKLIEITLDRSNVVPIEVVMIYQIKDRIRSIKFS